VTLPPVGGSVDDTAPSAFLGGGPAVILETGPLTAGVEGTTGPGGAVISSAFVEDVGPGPITADSIFSIATRRRRIPMASLRSSAVRSWSLRATPTSKATRRSSMCQWNRHPTTGGAAGKGGVPSVGALTPP